MKNRIRLVTLAVAAAVPLTLSAGVASASYSTPGYGGGYETIGQEGCTPGYWKNHTEDWQRYSTSAPVSSVFAATAGTSFADVTLLQALSLKGGPGVDGATQILLRAATAAVLSAAHGDVDYSASTSAIVTRVNTALASEDRQTILAEAALLDRSNNAGCPL